MMMMMELQKATAHVDVYLVGSNNTGVAGAAAACRRRAGCAARRRSRERPQSPTQRHFGYANLAGYPAINVPNGFGETGGPTNAVIYGQPYPRAGDHRAREGVSGCRRLPSAEADEAGSGHDDTSAIDGQVLRSCQRSDDPSMCSTVQSPVRGCPFMACLALIASLGYRRRAEPSERDHRFSADVKWTDRALSRLRARRIRQERPGTGRGALQRIGKPRRRPARSVEGHRPQRRRAADWS